MRERRCQDRRRWERVMRKELSGVLGEPGVLKRSDGECSWGRQGNSGPSRTSDCEFRRMPHPVRQAPVSTQDLDSPQPLCPQPGQQPEAYLLEKPKLLLLHEERGAQTPLRTCRGRAPPPPPRGRASGRDKKGNLINSFHIQHFPHSIIFKLNNLSLGEKGKFPLSSALPGLTKPTLWGPMENESPWSPPSMPPFIFMLTGSPSHCSCTVETLAHSHMASVGSCQLPGAWGGGTEELWVEQNDRQEKPGYRRQCGGSERWLGFAVSLRAFKTQVFLLPTGRP